MIVLSIIDFPILAGCLIDSSSISMIRLSFTMMYSRKGRITKKKDKNDPWGNKNHKIECRCSKCRVELWFIAQLDMKGLI